MNDKQKEFLKQLKQHREMKKEERKKQYEQEAKLHNERKQAKRDDKQKNKVYYKEQKQKIKVLKHECNEKLKALHNNKELDREALKLEKQTIRDEYSEKIITIKNEILDRKFEFGKKYKTLSWKLLKWTHGIRKEFNRIIWSSPNNTFKYLAIIVVLVLILSAIFIAIDAIVNTFC